MALVGVIPKPTHVLDLFSAVADQGVVDGDHPAPRIARRGTLLQPFQAMFVEPFPVPSHLRNPAVQAGLIGGLDELGVDRRYIFAFGHHQPGQILAKVTALRGVGEEAAELGHRVFNHRGKINNTWHEQPLSWPGETKAGDAFVLPNIPSSIEFALPSILDRLSQEFCLLQKSSLTLNSNPKVEKDLLHFLEILKEAA